LGGGDDVLLSSSSSFCFAYFSFLFIIKRIQLELAIQGCRIISIWLYSYVSYEFLYFILQPSSRCCLALKVICRDGWPGKTNTYQRVVPFFANKSQLYRNRWVLKICIPNRCRQLAWLVANAEGIYRHTNESNRLSRI
jgi:hypothetical protein